MSTFFNEIKNRQTCPQVFGVKHLQAMILHKSFYLDVKTHHSYNLFIKIHHTEKQIYNLKTFISFQIPVEI